MIRLYLVELACDSLSLGIDSSLFTNQYGCDSLVITQTLLGLTDSVSFNAIDSACVSGGIQTGLGGGLPVGGVYSGPGVTDEGNGETFSFDPTSLAGGTYELTYAYEHFPFQIGQDIEGESANDLSGRTLAMSADGNRMIIGSVFNQDVGNNAGQVRMYEFNGSQWVQMGQDIEGEGIDNQAGASVAMSLDGNRIAIGAVGNGTAGNFAGNARVFQWNGSSWAQVGQNINGEAAGDESGFAVALSSNGNRIAIGSPRHDTNGNSAGRVRIFDWNGSNWLQVGQELDGEAAEDLFGNAVSLSANGNILAVGARENDGAGAESGHVRLFELLANTWTQIGQDIDGEASGDLFGFSVSLSASGNRVAVGARDNNGGGTGSGHLRIFQWSGNAWLQLGQDLDGEVGGDQFGHSVSLSGDGSRVAAGAPGNSSGRGHVRVFDWDGSAWTLLGRNIQGENNTDLAGWGVALSSNGSLVGMGSPNNNNSSGNAAGQVQVFSLDTICVTEATDLVVIPPPDTTFLTTFTCDSTEIGVVTQRLTSQFGCDSTVITTTLLGDPVEVRLTIMDSLCISEGIQTGLSGGQPQGGLYAGLGVTDDGNGMTFSFDPAVAGIGPQEISYTYRPNTSILWTQLGLDMDGESEEDNSGISVSISGDGQRLAIGANQNDGSGDSTGHVRVYEWNGSVWNQLGNDIDGEANGDNSGISVSLSSDGSRLAIGAHLNGGNGPESGHVRVYEWNGAAWIQLGADIDGEAAGDQSGWSLSLSADGNRLAVGANLNDGNGSFSGHVRVYQWDGSSWTPLGGDIDGEMANDQSGWSVAFSSDGNRLAIGAIFNGGSGTESGHVRVFEWNGTVWTQLGMDIEGETANDFSGYSVSLTANGYRLAVGAITNGGNGSESGQVRVYQWNGTAWTQLGSDIDGEAAGDRSGWSVTLSSDGSRLAIGAPQNGGNGAISGQVRVYEWNGSSWIQIGPDIEGEAAGDFSGRSVSFSSDGSRLAIGAPSNNGNGNNSGHVRVFELNGFCPSTSIDTILVLPNDTTHIAATTCDPSLVGVLDSTFINQFGCDSTVITTTILNPGPTIICPSDLTINCVSQVDTSFTGTPLVIGDCGPVDLHFSDTVIPGPCPDDFTIIREWIANDSTGLIDTCSQLITVIDTTAPQIVSSIPQDMFLNCTSDIPPPMDLTAEDNCGGQITVSPRQALTFGDCLNDLTLVRTWTFADTCGNVTSYSQTITVLDTLAPVITSELPQDLTLECASDIPPPMDLTAEDNCGAQITVSPRQELTFGDCLNDLTLVRTWTFADTCGNTTSYSQTITVLDTLAPVLTDLPSDIVVCEGEPVQFSLPSAIDNCDGTVRVFCIRSDGLALSDPYPLGETLITCSAADTCGNTASSSFSVTVNPNAFAGQDTSLVVCDTITVDLSLLVSEAGGSFEDPGATGGLSGDSFTTDGLATGIYTLDYIVPGENGCKSDTAQIKLEVIECVPECVVENLALGKPTETPCDYGNSYSGLGVDGVLQGSTPWTSNPDIVHICQEHEDDWWQVDLGDGDLAETFEDIRDLPL